MAEYEIPAVNFSRLQDQIAQLNKRATKLKCEAISFKVLETFTKTFHTEILGEPYQRRYYRVEVEGKAPTLNGWSFVAKIEPHQAGNLVKTTPAFSDYPIKPAYYHMDMDCQHCNKTRIRNEVFLLRHENLGALGEQEIVVGRNCLADFLGHSNPEWLAKIAEWDIELSSLMRDAEDERGWGRSYRHEEDVAAFLALVAGLARQYGFVTKSQDPFNATANLAWDVVLGDKDTLKRLERDGFSVIATDVRQAEAALTWIRSMEQPHDNNYMANLWIACKADSIDGRAAGIVASLISAYTRHIEKEAKTASESKGQVSKHLGVEGGKFSGRVKIVSVRTFEPQNWYENVRTLVRMEQNGNILTWWTGTSPDVEADDEVDVKGTIKKHDEYNGQKQTVLTRCKIS
jgi:hypothetical protein